MGSTNAKYPHLVPIITFFIFCILKELKMMRKKFNWPHMYTRVSREELIEDEDRADPVPSPRIYSRPPSTSAIK